MSGIVLDICTTAMPRPELHRQTYSSFYTNLCGVDWDNSTHYVNIDPYPTDSLADKLEMESIRDECELVSKGHFKNSVSNRTEVGNQAKACKWCWGQTTADYVLNLEDDWVLYQAVNINNMLAWFEREDTLQVVFRWRTQRRHRHYLPYFVLGPSIVRGELLRMLAKELNEVNNPEIQLRSRKDFSIPIPNLETHEREELYKYFIVHSQGRHGTVAQDIGLPWIAASRFRKPQCLGPLDPKRQRTRNAVSWVL